jgi:hypothetical protein
MPGILICPIFRFLLSRVDIEIIRLALARQKIGRSAPNEAT